MLLFGINIKGTTAQFNRFAGAYFGEFAIVWPDELQGVVAVADGPREKVLAFAKSKPEANLDFEGFTILVMEMPVGTRLQFRCDRNADYFRAHLLDKFWKIIKLLASAGYEPEIALPFATETTPRLIDSLVEYGIFSEARLIEMALTHSTDMRMRLAADETLAEQAEQHFRLAKQFAYLDAAISKHLDELTQKSWLKFIPAYNEIRTHVYYTAHYTYGKIGLRALDDNSSEFYVAPPPPNRYDTLTPEQLAEQLFSTNPSEPPHVVYKNEEERLKLIALYTQTVTDRRFALENHQEIVRDLVERLKQDGLWVEETGTAISILFLSADPTDASRLRLGEEYREIQEKLQLAKERDRFTLYQRFSVRPPDISQALLDTMPRIVHFAGHGTATGELCFEDKVGKLHPIAPDTLAALFKEFAGQVNCVVLNACYSETQAKAISKNIDYVVGMNHAVGDDAAIAFSIGFYQGLGAGRSVEEAFELGRVQILLHNIPDALVPVLLKKTSTLSG